MTLQEFKNQLENIYLSHFPKSKIHIDYSSNLYSSIYIRMYLSESYKECANNIINNDMFSICFCVDCEKDRELPKLTNDSLLPDNMQLKADSNIYRIKPESHYYYCSSKKVNFRLTKGNSEKIIKSLEKFIINLKSQLLLDYKADLIHKDNIDLFKLKMNITDNN